jgi:nucleolar protein 56
VHKVKTSAGEFQIDEKGTLLEFMVFESDDESVEALTQNLGDLPSSEGLELFFSRQNELIEEAGLGQVDYAQIRRRVAIKLAREMLSQSLGEDDLIIEAIETLKDVNKALNIIVLRLAASYSRRGVPLNVEEKDIDPLHVLEAGKEVSAHSVDVFAGQIESLMKYKDYLEGEIEELMKLAAPNTYGLVGPLLGARLISIARGLERLSVMPASRIQVLGAERAMFRHLKEKGSPPKHGIIFQHPTISKSPWWQRGKIARSLAAKIAIASRLDAYSGLDRSEELKADFMKRYEAVKKTYSQEPKKMRIIKAPKTRKTRRRR